MTANQETAQMSPHPFLFCGWGLETRLCMDQKVPFIEWCPLFGVFHSTSLSLTVQCDDWSYWSRVATTIDVTGY